MSHPEMRPAQRVGRPEGRRAAATFTFDLDAESVVLSADPSSAGRMSVMSHQAYGPLTGVPRLLRMLERQRVRSTFFVPGYTAHRHPGVVRDIVAAGHEIAHHGYLHEPLIGVAPDLEAEYLDRGLDALEKEAGARPGGYRAPMWELTWSSPRLLADRGFLYDSSLMDTDDPYEPAVDDTRSLVEIPVHWGLDDWEQYCFIPRVSGTWLIESPRKALEMWSAEYRAVREEGGCFVLTAHPFLSGRPSRAAALEELVGEAVGDPGTWVASLGEIAVHVRSAALEPRTVLRPDPVPTVRSTRER